MDDQKKDVAEQVIMVPARPLESIAKSFDEFNKAFKGSSKQDGPGLKASYEVEQLYEVIKAFTFRLFQEEGITIRDAYRIIETLHKDIAWQKINVLG